MEKVFFREKNNMIDQIKMIVTDLDGTLLCDDKTVSAFNIKTLGRCKDNSIKIVYATGRGDNSKRD